MTDFTLSKKKSPRRIPKKMRTVEEEYGPRTESILLILGYSKALQVVDAPPLGQVDVILN